MFTGIIREVGLVRELDGSEAGVRLTVEAPRSRASLTTGGSIAVELPVNGTTFDSWTAHPEISGCSD